MTPKAKYPLWVFVPELFVAQGNIAAFCQKIRAAGAWGVRVFWLQSWAAVRLVPWLQAVYNGKPVRLYNAQCRLHCPVTDMTKPNPAFWNRANEINKIFEANDLEMIVTLGDNCSQSPRQYKLSYPFMASLQTMSKQDVWPWLDPPDAKKICTPSPGGLYGKAKFGLYQTFTKNVIKFMNASGVKYRIEIQNEFSRLDWPKTAPEPAAWYAMMVKAALDAGLPAGRLVHSGDQSIVLKHPGVFSMHRIEQPGLYPTTADFSRMMISGDGGYSGRFPGRSKTDYDVLGHHGVSVPDGIGLARMTRLMGIGGGIEVMQKSLWRKSDFLADVDYAQTDVLAAITAEWKK